MLIDILPIPIVGTKADESNYMERSYNAQKDELKNMTKQELEKALSDTIREIDNCDSAINRRDTDVDKGLSKYPRYTMKEDLANLNDYKEKIIDEIVRRGGSVKIK
jgi:hypothetical protein